MKKLLIISNNVLSENNNNGKTILSFIEGLDNVKTYQLYFSGEIPRVKGYNYYQISDKHIIKGLVNPRNRGTIYTSLPMIKEDDYSIRNKIGRNIFTLVLRDLLWFQKWNSPKLRNWLNDIKPDSVFFVAGDSLFTYPICSYIVKLFNSRLTVYVTDDYIMPRENEDFLNRIRRRTLKLALGKILSISDCFYTISMPMKKDYDRLFKVDSQIAVNMVTDIKHENTHENDDIILTYTGSFYYGRDNVLSELAEVIDEYNKLDGVRKAQLQLYSNSTPNEYTLSKININESSVYKGSLNRDQVIEQLNNSDALVFAESFENSEFEKVRYSLSTKVPEYMSVGKPIIAIGPINAGSIDYLKDVSIIIDDPLKMKSTVTSFLSNYDDYRSYGELARRKYLINHNKLELQKLFVENVLGKE